MKISIITSPFGRLPPTGIGAIEKRWYNVGTFMGSIGNEVIFYCKKDSVIRQSSNINVHFVHLRGFNRTGKLIGDIFLDFIYTVKAIFALKPCDVLVLNTFWSPFLCLLTRNKYQVSVYNVARFPKGQFKYFKFIDRLSCVSDAVEKAVIEQAPDRRNQMKVINNPVDTKSFFFRSKLPPCGGIRLCYTGRVHPEKGLDILVKAYVVLKKTYPNLRLSIVGARTIGDGGGGEGYSGFLERLADGHLIDWVEPISDASSLADEIAKCDIYCYPSVAERGETFGVAPLEAMAVGRATIVSALDCFKDFIEDGVTGLVFDHRDNCPEIRLAEKIEYLILNPGVRGKIAQLGSQIAHEKFSTESIALQYLEDFKYLLRVKQHAKTLS
ncbi:MAG: lipopolysaccharide N-acetylglucosaminyltransferase [Methylobacter sp.]|nr:MAG: lipopolysaccharide N-acetylglucosaminyltransferase [Methylobacter sp.]